VPNTCVTFRETIIAAFSQREKITFRAEPRGRDATLPTLQYFVSPFWVKWPADARSCPSIANHQGFFRVKFQDSLTVPARIGNRACPLILLERRVWHLGGDFHNLAFLRASRCVPELHGISTIPKDDGKLPAGRSALDVTRRRWELERIRWLDLLAIIVP